MRALYDFVPDEKAELRLTQGDRVGVLVAPSEGDSWLLVQSTDGASVGFVPSNFLGPDKTVRAAGGLAAAAPPPPPPASVKPLNAVAAAAAAASNVGTVANRPPPPPPPGANIAPLAPKHKHASHDAHAPAAPHSRVDTGLPPILKH